MNLNPAVNLEEAQGLANCRMPQFLEMIAAFHFRIDHANTMLEERRQVARRQVTVFVDGRCQDGATMLAVPCWIVRASAKERNAVGSARDNHSSFGGRLSGNPTGT